MRNNIIVIEGTPPDGFKTYGPFDTYEEAQEWADANCNNNWSTDQVRATKLNNAINLGRIEWTGKVEDLEFSLFYDYIDGNGHWVQVPAHQQTWHVDVDVVKRGAEAARDRADRRNISIGVRPVRNRVEIKHYDPGATFAFLDDAEVFWGIKR